MEFDAKLKREIIGQAVNETAYLAGIINVLGKIVTTKEIDNLYITHTMYEIALDAVRIIKNLYKRAEIEMTFEEPHGAKKVRGYVVIVDNKVTKDILRDFNLVAIEDGLEFRNNKIDKIVEDNDRLSYLQGVFLGKGRVFLPVNDNNYKKLISYQLEMVLASRKQLEFIKEISNKLELDIKDSERRDNYILYIKDSEKISDFLALMGASEAVLELQSLIIERDVRNNANRAVNCNVANISKAIDAAEKQIEAIRIIEKRQGLSVLDDKLQELARVRLENPEATLTDLAEMLEDRVTKSGINHRMRKLMQIAYND